MPFSEQWKALRSRLQRFRTWVATPEGRHGLLLALWPVVALVIAVLMLRRVSTAKDLADLISAIASLAWPLVTLTIVSWFWPEIRVVLSKIRKGKIFGLEFELNELQAKTEAAEAKLAPVTRTASVTLDDVRVEAAGTVGPAPAQDEIDEVLRETARSPRLGLMLLSAKIERAARELAVASGLDVSHKSVGPASMVRLLAQAEQLPSEAAEALNLFSRVRNRIVHGHDADDEEVARAIDSGTRLLRLLLSQPRSRPQTPNESES